jgi:hypothetical protein
VAVGRPGVGEKFWLSRVSPTPPYFFEFVFFISSKKNYVTYRFQTLQITVILQLEYGKNISEFFFVKFSFFKYLKFNKIVLLSIYI